MSFYVACPRRWSTRRWTRVRYAHGDSVFFSFKGAFVSRRCRIILNDALHATVEFFCLTEVRVLFLTRLDKCSAQTLVITAFKWGNWFELHSILMHWELTGSVYFHSNNSGSNTNQIVSRTYYVGWILTEVLLRN